ncbi:MAG: hypothetical protein ACREOA_05850 [Candidatus Dormibacteria bacterium]
MIDQRTLDNAVSRLLGRFQAEDIGQLIAEDGSIWDALSAMERFQFGLFRREIAEVLQDLSGFYVLAAVQRVRPELGKLLSDDVGLPWLGQQVDDLRERATA